MKTLSSPKAVREIMAEKEVTGAAMFRAMESNEPGIGRQKAYDRIKSINPKLSTLNLLMTILGYSVVLVPNERVGKLGDDCYKIVPEKRDKK